MGSRVGKHGRAATGRIAMLSLTGRAALHPAIADANWDSIDPYEKCVRPIKGTQVVVPSRAQMKPLLRSAVTSGLKWALLLAVSSVVMMPPVFAQDGVETWVEFRKHVEGAEHIAALEQGFAGDSVSLYDGATTFSVTDTAVPGNSGLPVELVRRVSIELQVQSGGTYEPRLLGAGNWLNRDWCGSSCLKGWRPARLPDGNALHASFGSDAAVAGRVV